MRRDGTRPRVARRSPSRRAVARGAFPDASRRPARPATTSPPTSSPWRRRALLHRRHASDIGAARASPACTRWASGLLGSARREPPGEQLAARGPRALRPHRARARSLPRQARRSRAPAQLDIPEEEPGDWDSDAAAARTRLTRVMSKGRRDAPRGRPQAALDELNGLTSELRFRGGEAEYEVLNMLTLATQIAKCAVLRESRAARTCATTSRRGTTSAGASTSRCACGAGSGRRIHVRGKR